MLPGCERNQSLCIRFSSSDTGAFLCSQKTRPSHNPPEYNGYKVYWEDGAQITPPHDKGIMDEVKAVTDYTTMKTMPAEDAKAAGLYEVIGAEVDDAYIAELKKQVIHQDAIDAVGKDLKIVYSPLHGTGNIPARRILKELGFENVYVVKETANSRLFLIRIRRRQRHLNWDLSWQEKWMQTLCLLQIRMQTVWVSG